MLRGPRSWPAVPSVQTGEPLASDEQIAKPAAGEADGTSSRCGRVTRWKGGESPPFAKGRVFTMIASSAVAQDFGRMAELARQGFHCSEVLLILGLEAQGKTNPDLIKSISGLAGGVGFSADICGAVTGGACLIGLYAGRGSAEVDEDPRARIMIGEFMEWFAQEQEERYGGIHCRDIIGDDPRNVVSRCPRVVGRVYRKVRAILAEHGYTWENGSRPSDRSQATTTCTGACPAAARL